MNDRTYANYPSDWTSRDKMFHRWACQDLEHINELRERINKLEMPWWKRSYHRLLDKVNRKLL